MLRTFLLVVVVGAFLYDAYSSERLFKKKTDAEANLLKLTESSVQRFSYQLFRVAFMGYVFLLLVLLFHPVAILEFPTFRFLDRPLCILTGFIVSMCGIWLMHKAREAMGLSWRIGFEEGERTELVTDSPFTFSRNPFFLGIMVALFGIILIVPQWMTLFLWTIASIAMGYQARMEEDYLRQAHGSTYIEYARSTGRFLPWVGKLEK
jgi:protein-S-isoprenylcysteine O-methyltransferase Ste14